MEAWKTVLNPDRKWFQFWKKKYVMRKQTKSGHGEYKVEGKNVTVRIFTGGSND